MSNEEFSLQLRLAKTWGYLESPPSKWKCHLQFLHLIIALDMTFSIFTFAAYIFENYRNTVDTTECIAALVTASLVFTKYLLFLFYKKEIFEMINEVKELNKKCK